MNYSELVGLRVKEGAPIWSARLILGWGQDRVYEVSLVHDRQGIEGGDAAHQAVLLSCLNGNRLMPAIEAVTLMFQQHPERRNSEVPFEMFKDDKLVIRANPNRSHGYLYVSAALVKDVEPMPTIEEVATLIEGETNA